jgi:tetratricopeptide (TPR) repeat protein
MSRYKIARLDEIEELDDGRAPMRPVRHHFGITSFGINAWTGRNAGDRVINEHDEADDGHEELYLVTQGRATFEIDGERHDAPTGTCIFVPAGVKRSAVAEEEGTTVVAVGGVPGKPYEVFGWELWSPLRPLYEARRYDELIEKARALAQANDYPLLYYNLACCESLAGRRDDALEHLRIAVEHSDQTREFAQGDSDFDAIRDDPEFKKLVGAEDSAG